MKQKRLIKKNMSDRSIRRRSTWDGTDGEIEIATSVVEIEQNKEKLKSKSKETKTKKSYVTFREERYILAQEAKLDLIERATNHETKNLISCFETESNEIGDVVTRENIG